MRFKRQRGTQDILPEDASRWYQVTTRMRQVLESYGYGEIRTPLFEDTQLFVRGVGTETDIVQKEMYTFPDHKGRSITLRPEGTASVTRAFLEHNLGREGGVHRFFYIGPMYRYSRPQPGRFREFFQVGAEAIGTDLPEQDAEVIDVMMQILRELGLAGLRVEVNSLGNAESRAAYVEVLRRELGDAGTPAAPSAQLCETCQTRVPRNPLRIFDCKNEACRQIAERLPKLSGFLSAEDRAHFDAVRGALDALGIEHVQNDLLVRGLDYYTRTAFEVHYAPLGSQSALGGGGRYDGLIEACGGPPTPAVGFSAGIERILYAVQESAAAPPAAADAPVVVLPLGATARVEALRLARQLRRVAPARVDLTGRSLKAQLRTAGRDARIAVILGDQELQKREASVRDLVRGEQHSAKLDELPDIVKRTLASTAGRSPE